MFHQKLYVSFSNVPITPVFIKGLLAKASVNNQRDGITGVLLVNSNMFMQLIEGEKEAVEKKFNTIKSDKRHQEITLLYEHDSPVRFFGEWSMAFSNINQCDANFIKKIMPYFDQKEKIKSPLELIQFLKGFSESFGGKKAG